MSLTKHHKKAANFILTDIISILKQKNISIKEFDIPVSHIAQLIDLLGDEKISSWIGKELFAKMITSGKSPKEIIDSENLSQTSESELINIVESVLKDNQKSISDYKNGKDHALKYLMGQVMKLSKGKANPVRATEIILEKIK